MSNFNFLSKLYQKKKSQNVKEIKKGKNIAVNFAINKLYTVKQKSDSSLQSVSANTFFKTLLQIRFLNEKNSYFFTDNTAKENS